MYDQGDDPGDDSRSTRKVTTGAAIACNSGCSYEGDPSEVNVGLGSAQIHIIHNFRVLNIPTHTISKLCTTANADGKERTVGSEGVNQIACADWLNPPRLAARIASLALCDPVCIQSEVSY